MAGIELKPVKCGCGGEARTELSGEPFAPWIVKCPTCGTRTELQDTEAEAIQAWNRAMSERTAKVENIEDPAGLGAYGDCSECGAEVTEQYAYCPNCGARLEWK